LAGPSRGPAAVRAARASVRRRRVAEGIMAGWIERKYGGGRHLSYASVPGTKYIRVSESLEFGV
jgi:hypothetical protein